MGTATLNRLFAKSVAKKAVSCVSRQASGALRSLQSTETWLELNGFSKVCRDARQARLFEPK